MGKKNMTGGLAAEQLLSIIQRVEKLEEEKAAIAADISDVFAEAKGNGFDTKTIRAIIKLRKLSDQEREEQEALLDIYKAALGMLNGTPLGEAALKRLSDEKKENEKHDAGEGSETNATTQANDATEVQQEPQATIEEAREMAKKAAKEGRPVSDNPFPARDPRRAAWDEEWCRASGSDGMDLPDAWKRKPKPKDSEERGDE
jgi:uncharacterized protein (UPF0335 family)